MCCCYKFLFQCCVVRVRARVCRCMGLYKNVSAGTSLIRCQEMASVFSISSLPTRNNIVRALNLIVHTVADCMHCT